MYINGYQFTDNDTIKIIHSKDFNLTFNKKTGFAQRWGKTQADQDDPMISQLGPTVMDLELCTDIPDDKIDLYKGELKLQNNKCKGKCAFCYKSNGFSKYTHFVPLVKFKQLLMKLCNTHIKFGDKLIYFLDPVLYQGKVIRAIDKPDLDWQTEICNCSPLLQLAFGITNLDANPELLQICQFCRKIGIVPNLTCHGKDIVSDQFLTRLCSLCGNIAVSRYDKNLTYNFLQRLHYCGIKYTNMHVFISKETFDQTMQAMNDCLTDKRLKFLSSIVLLFVKQKGRGQKFHQVTQEQFNKLFTFALDNGVSFGMDICCTNKFDKFIKKYHNQQKNFGQVYDFCDSSRFSGYCNTLGQYCPCSFIQGDGIWVNSPNVYKCHNFIDQIWNGKQQDLYRTMLLSNSISCVYYQI